MKIEVNHQALNRVASAIKSYCAKQNLEMMTTDTTVKMMLISDWVGIDADEFKRMWEGVDAKGSAAINLRDSLQNFSEALTACSSAYKAAQEEVYYQALRLPRW